MNEKTLFISLLAIVLIVLASISPVVGTNIIKSNIDTEKINSPLFTIRAQHYFNKEKSKMINSHYLGEDRTFNILINKEKTQYDTLDKALKLFGRNPILTNQIIEILLTNQIFINFLNDNEISISEFKTYIYLIQNEPFLLKEKIKTNQMDLKESVLNSIMPLNLETTDPIACFFVALALAIVAVVFAIIISTLTIITCLNIGNCLEKIGQKILDNIMQGLIPPG
jgi:hypothetical protein